MSSVLRRSGLLASVLACCLAPAGLWAAEQPTEELVSAQVLKQLEDASPLDVEKLLIPIRDIRGPMVASVKNPRTGSWNILIHYFETYTRNHYLVLVDVAKNEYKTIHYPHALINTFYPVHEHGRIFFHGMGGISVYDTATNDIKVISSTMGGETRPFTLGPDGMLYVTGSDNHHPLARKINPKTLEVTDYGQVGPSHAPNGCWGYFINADEKYIYIGSGKIPWRLVAFNRETKESKVLLTVDDPNGLVSFGTVKGKRAAFTRFSDSKQNKRYWLGDGQVTLITDEKTPPAHASDAPKASAPIQFKTDSDWKPDGEGVVVAPLEFEDGKKIDLKFTIPTFPANVYQVSAGPDGKIYGSGGNYLGIFIYDPQTNTSRHLANAPVSIPLLNWIDGKLIMSGYPRGVTLSYDPTKPWTGRNKQSDRNPANVVHLGNEGAGFHIAYASAVGADGKFYATGGWYRNGNGGGLGWVDVATKQAGGIHEGMGSYRTTHLTAVGNGRYMVMSSKTVMNQDTGEAPPAQARIFVYDIQEGKLTSFETIKDVNHTGAIAGAPGDSTTVLAITSYPYPAEEKPENRASLLYAFDALTGKVLWQKKLPHACGFIPNENFDGSVGFQMITGPDGFIWTYLGGKMAAVDPARHWGLAYEDARLVRINPANGEIHVVGIVGTAGKMAFLNKDVYLTGGSKYHLEGSGSEYLRRVKNVLK